MVRMLQYTGRCTDLVPDAVRQRPVPAPRSKLAAPVEPRIPVPVPHRSQRQTAGKHSNLYSLPKSVCNIVSFTPDVLSQVLAGMVMYMYFMCIYKKVLWTVKREVHEDVDLWQGRV